VATTEERMMIMGLCLQGILANPNLTGLQGGGWVDPETIARQLQANVELAHRYADKLMLPLPAATDAANIKRLSVTAYEVLRAAGELDDNDAPWGSGHADEDEVFDAVRAFYAMPDVVEVETLTPAMKLVRAVVMAGRFLNLVTLDPNQGDLFAGGN
jgi:hypothetical protein